MATTTSHPEGNPKRSLMPPTEQLAVIVPALAELVDQLGPADLHRATPCDRFDVHDVLNHMLTLAGSFAYLFRGEEPPEPMPLTDDGSVPATRFRAVMDDLLDAVRSDGAMERTIVSPVGEMPGEAFARLVAFDGTVHGWDLARATGRAWRLPDDVVADVDTFASQAISDAMRDGDTFKASTTPPSTATPIERLAAFSGRTV